MLEYRSLPGWYLAPIDRNELEYSSDMGELEYSGGGFVTSVCNRATSPQPSDLKAWAAPDSIGFIGGYATRWNKPHVYKGMIDVFVPGAFTTSLAAKNFVPFCEDHNTDLTFATSNGGGLELRSDDVGLAFIADVSGKPGGARAFELVKTNAKRGMSVGYHVLDSKMDVIEGKIVRLIKSANLRDIALCDVGCVAEAYAEIVDQKISEPRHLTKSEADVEASHAKMMTANRKLSEALRRG